MDVARPHAALAPTTEGDVLVALAGTTRPLTGREVHRLVGQRSSRAVQVALDKLVRQGIVTRQEAGRAFLHTLNRDHLAAPAVEVLANLRTELHGRLARLVAGWTLEPVHVSIFGSAARGDGDTSSDVDLFVVRLAGVDAEDPVWRSQVEDLEERVQSWTGNRAEVHELAEGDRPRFVRSRAPLLAELRASGVDVYGQRLYELLKHRKGR